MFYHVKIACYQIFDKCIKIFRKYNLSYPTDMVSMLDVVTIGVKTSSIFNV